MMKKNRLIFYLVFGALHLFILLFTIYMDSQKENFQFLLQLQGKIWMLKYCSFFLLIMMVLNVVLHYRDNRRNEKDKEDLRHEVNVLKAKVYDYQQGKGPASKA